MTRSPLVSVVVATFNRARLLACVLQSIRAQTFEDYEVWVVGDGCTDNSGSVVEELADDRFHWINLSSNHRAPHAAHNTAIERASGKYIAYLNHDDLWFPWHLSSLVAFSENSNLEFSYDMLALKTSEGWSFAPEIRWYPKPGACPSGWLHTRSINVQWRDPYEAGFATDADFLIRVREKNVRIGFLRQLGGIMVPSGVGGTYSSDSFIQSELLESMKASPESLARELLTEGAIDLSSLTHRVLYPTLGEAVRKLGRLCLLRLLFAISGRPVLPWPLLQRWYFRHSRKRANRRRGLTF